MATSRITFVSIIAILIILVPFAAMGDDTRIIYRHDRTGVADEINQIKEFDYELKERERDRIAQEAIDNSGDAQDVGDVYYEKGRIEEAIIYYQIAIKLDPSNTEAHEKFIAAGKKEKAETSPRYHRAMQYYRQGMTEKAVDELIREIKENPENEKARIKLNEIER